MKHYPRIHILTSSEVEVTPRVKRLITSVVRNHATKAARLLSLSHPFNVTIYPNATWVMPSTGDGGYAPAKDWLQLSIDLTGKKHNIETIITKRLPATIYHEMNHLKRWASPGYGTTLLEVIVTEGIACAFEHEMWQTGRSPFYKADEKEVRRMLQLVKKHAKNKTFVYVHSDWFYGTNPKIPKWLGYKVGFYIVRQVLANNPKKTVIELTSMQASEILALSRLF